MLKIQKTYQKSVPKLFLVATPIGNLQEFNQRAHHVLNSEVAVIFCENKLIAKKLLQHWKINRPLYTLHKFNERSQTKKILTYLRNGENVAIITCAGVPLIADPGHVSVQAALQENFYVTAIGISSAFLNALICSGLPINQFSFHNFLKVKLSQKTTQLNQWLNSSETFVCYEAIHRLAETIRLLQKLVPDRQFCLAKELTKLHETFYRGTFRDFSFENFPLRGEFVLVISGQTDATFHDHKLNQFLNRTQKFALTPKQVLALGTDLGYRKKVLYQRLTKLNQASKISSNDSNKSSKKSSSSTETESHE